MGIGFAEGRAMYGIWTSCLTSPDLLVCIALGIDMVGLCRRSIIEGVLILDTGRLRFPDENSSVWHGTHFQWAPQS